jgi:hypothetical protein
MNGQATTTIGTTPHIFLPKESTSGDGVKFGEGYFRIRIAAAQAAVYGAFYQQNKHVMITSDVTLNCEPFGGAPLRNIQRIREVQKNTATQLGLASNLVDLTPATMERVTVGIEYLADTRNRFAMLIKLANDDAFLSVISLAPGVAAVAKQVTGLAEKLVSTFFDDDGKTPLMRFLGDFNLSDDDGGLRDGYYAILASAYDKHPLRRPFPKHPELKFVGGDLLYNEQPITQWSYVVLDVDTVPVRGRSLGVGEPWHEKLKLAESRADAIQNNPFSTKQDRTVAWEACQALLRDSSVLLIDSPLYLPTEVRSIVALAYKDAHDRIFPESSTSLGAPSALRSVPDFLGPGDAQHFATLANEYAERENESNTKLRDLGLL